MDTHVIHPALATQYAAAVTADTRRRAEELRRANAFRTDQGTPQRRRRIRMLPPTFGIRLAWR